MFLLTCAKCNKEFKHKVQWQKKCPDCVKAVRDKRKTVKVAEKKISVRVCEYCGKEYGLQEGNYEKYRRTSYCYDCRKKRVWLGHMSHSSLKPRENEEIINKE